MQTRAVVTLSFAVMVACGGLATEGSGRGADASNDGSRGAAGSSGSSGGGGSGSGGSSGSGGGSGTATGGTSGAGGGGGSSGAVQDAGPPSVGCPAGDCVRCSDGMWHCGGMILPPCPRVPSGTKGGCSGSCELGMNTACLKCQSGNPVSYVCSNTGPGCDGEPLAGGLSCKP
jgi:hypothetical protein